MLEAQRIARNEGTPSGGRRTWLTTAAQGLFNRMVEPRKLRAATLELLGSVTASTREVIAAQKGLFETWLNHGLQYGIDNSIDVFADVLRAPATAEAIAQYQQSRSRP